MKRRFRMNPLTLGLALLRDVGKAVGMNGIVGAVGAAAAAAGAAAGAVTSSGVAADAAARGAGMAAGDAAEDAGWFDREQTAWAATSEWDHTPWWQKIFSSPPSNYRAPMKPIGGAPAGGQDEPTFPAPECNESGREFGGCNEDNPT
jgi:hypothetical protein